MRVLVCLLLVSILRADEQTQKMTTRVSEEAEAFQRLAVEVLGTETLHQKAQKPPARFRPRAGAAALSAPPAEWKEREIVSEYGFTTFAGAPDAVHELRQVISVDGRKVEDTKKAQDALAKAITASDDTRKKEMLKQFEKYGLVGAVTDFGQLILLFTRRDLERYEFVERGAKMLGETPVRTFAYKQVDGPEALTLIQADKNDQTNRLRLEGEIWVRADNYVPVRITLAAGQGDGPTAIREEAAVEYAMSEYGAVLPVSTTHRELHGGKVTVENQFRYTAFRKFGASSDVKFEVAK
jgi:hypothetical protein